MDHNFISDYYFLFNCLVHLYIYFKLGRPLPFNGWSRIVIIFVRKPWTNFSNYFSQIRKATKHWFFNWYWKMSWHISSLVRNVAIFPFNKNHLPHVENRVQKKENTHGFLSRFNVEHKLQHLLKLLYNNKKRTINNDHR